MNDKVIYQNKNIMDFLNSQSFMGLNGVECGSVLYNDYAGKLKKSSKNFCHSIGRILKTTVTIGVKVKYTNNNPKIAFLFSSSYADRVDHLDKFNKVKSLCDSRADFFPDIHFSLCGLMYLPFVFQWYRTMRRKLSRHTSIYLSSRLFRHYCDYRYIIKSLQSNPIKGLITLYDVGQVDSLVVNYCNKNNIITATLEHGYFIAGPQFSLSKSKYFLGYGQFIREQYIASGKNATSLVTVGMPQLIDADIPWELQTNRSKIIGVICNGSTLVDEDCAMIKIANKFSRQNGYRVYVKLHPGTDISHYPKEEIDNVDKIVVNEMSATDFGKIIEFAIISTSTVYIEYLVNLIPTFLYPSKMHTYDKEEWCTFHTYEDLNGRVNALYNNPSKYLSNALTAREYYTKVKNVRQNYQEFFDTIIENK